MTTRLLLLRTRAAADQYRLLVSFLAMAALLAFLDASMRLLFGVLRDGAGRTVLPGVDEQLLMDFAPEVWIGLLAMVLGTLIIVISIASQSTPKLIDLYMRDWTSLFYIWFITLAFLHNVLYQAVAAADGVVPEGSAVLSTVVLLPIAAFFAVPYIFYILGYTKTSNVIEMLHRGHLRAVSRLQQPLMRAVLDNPKVVAEHQRLLFSYLNQMDDLLEYIAYKEPKGILIRHIGEALRQYVEGKPGVNPRFFRMSHHVRNDISFKTYFGGFEDVDAHRTFYEEKAFRLLSNAYFKLMDRDDFDLATLCIYEVTVVGETALHMRDEPLVESVIIRLNTFLRFGIKHGKRTDEARNLYNALFHYSRFVSSLIQAGYDEHVVRCCGYLKNYGTEIFKVSADVPSFRFLVDVVAAEMKHVLQQVCEAGWSEERQSELLYLMLQMDSPPDFDKHRLEDSALVYDNVRILQVGLALFYLRAGQHKLAEHIVDDIIEDVRYLGEDLLRSAVVTTCNVIAQARPRFWEDTDRGNHNIYFSPDRQYLDAFALLFKNRLDAFISRRDGHRSVFAAPTPDEVATRVEDGPQLKA